MQCPQCSTFLEEGFQFCKCGAGLKMDESTISRIRKRFQDVLDSSYYVPAKRNRGKKHGNEQYQVDHAKAQDTLRNVLKDRKYESILKRFQKDSRWRESQIPHGWDEAYWRYVDFMASIDISHKASHGQRERYENSLRMKCGERNYQLGPLTARSDYYASTKAIMALAKEEGQMAEHVAKEDRYRSEALTPKLEKVANLASRLEDAFCCRPIITKCQLIHMLGLQLVVRIFQMVLER